MLQFGGTWEEFYMSHRRRVKKWACASVINLFVWFKWQGTTQTQLTQPAKHPPSRKCPSRMPGLKAVLKVKLVSVITVPLVSYWWGEKIFYTYVVKPLSRLQWYTAKSTEKYHLFPQVILVFIVNFDGKSISVNQWLPWKGGTRKCENIMLPTYRNQFLFLQNTGRKEWRKGKEWQHLFTGRMPGPKLH